MAAIVEPRDEAQLIASILGGEAELYHELIRPYERCVYMMALSYLQNAADAEDVAQQTFLKAFRHLASFRAEVNLCTWLVGIALDESRSRLEPNDALRMESIDDTFEQTDYAAPAILRDWHEILPQALDRIEVRQMLQKAIVGLPDAYREVFLLRDVEGLTNVETAAALSMNAGIVKARLHCARMMLQKQLMPQLRNLVGLPLRRLA